MMNVDVSWNARKVAEKLLALRPSVRRPIPTLDELCAAVEQDPELGKSSRASTESAIVELRKAGWLEAIDPPALTAEANEYLSK